MKIEIPIAIGNEKLSSITGKDETIYMRCTLETDQIEAIYENVDSLLLFVLKPEVLIPRVFLMMNY